MTLLGAADTRDPPDVVDLVARIRRGEEPSLSAAYFHYSAPLLALAARLTGNAADGPDVVQDLFVGLPEALARYEERGQFTAWLRSATVRLALMRLRRRRRRTRWETDDLRAAESVADRSGVTAEGMDLARPLSRLPDDQRTIVIRKALEGFSHDEIAELLGIRRNTAEVRFHRALLRLRAALEDR